MWQSIKLLVKGVIARWVQTLGGSLMAVIGFLADTQRWQIDPAILYALSLVFFLWALVKTFHDVRIERDQSNERLNEHRDCQAIADYLTQQHAYGIHELLHKPPTTVEALPEWNRLVENWNEAIFVEMEKLGCTPQDLNNVRTISILDVTAGVPELPDLNGWSASESRSFTERFHRRYARLAAETKRELERPVRMHGIRLSRVANVSTSYAQRAEAIRLAVTNSLRSGRP